MKRLLVLATAMLAFSATPALAAPIPYDDDDPDNWGAVYNLDLCNGQPCEYSATSTDISYTTTVGGVTWPPIPCTSITMTYEMEPHETAFVRTARQGANCPTYPDPVFRACVYSPSGFANGSADVELWFRDLWSNEDGLGWFAKAPGDAVGTYVYRFSSYEFDQQGVTLTDGAGVQGTVTIDGTFDVDGDPVLVEHDLGATPCAYPELS